MKPNEKIRVIVFDLEEVIVETWHHFPQFIPDMRTLDQSKFREIDESEERRAFYLGKIKESQFISEIIRISGTSASPTEIENTIRGVIVEKPGMRHILMQLRGKYKLALLTNFPKEWFDYLNVKYGLRELFDKVFVSGVTAIRKPDIEAYRQITDVFEVLPRECLFIDDKERNIKSAQEFGMNVIHFKNAAMLTDEFKRKWGISLNVV